MSSPFDDLARFCERLAEVDIHCLVVGSVAAMFFGEPRATIDIDLVIDAGPESSGRIASAFKDERYNVPPVATIERELRRQGGMFNIVDTTTGLKADCYTAGRDELGGYQFTHAISGTLGTTPVSFAPAAAIIAMKLRYHALSGQDSTCGTSARCWRPARSGSIWHSWNAGRRSRASARCGTAVARGWAKSSRVSHAPGG